MLSTHTFDTGELTLSYVEGPNNGPPVLFLHGLLGRWQWTEPVMRPLINHWHAYACDLRGHGESGRAPRSDGYLLQDYVHDIVAFIHEEIPNGRRVALVGFSLGALIAMGAASALPDEVSGIMLIEPPLMLRNHAFRDMPIASLFDVAYEATRKSSAIDDLIATCYAVMPDAEETWVMEIALQLSKIDPEVTNPELLDKLLDGLDLETMLAGYRESIMLLHGEPELGSLVQPGDVAWMREHAPNAEIIPIPEAGHGAPPEFVLEHGQRFLNTLR